jgi:hypothetical protein
LLQGFHIGDTRILAAASAVWPPLIIRVRLQCDSEPLDAYRIAGLIEPNSCNADPRVVIPGGEPRKQVEFTIRTTNGSRIQDAFDLLWITWRLRSEIGDLRPTLRAASVVF